MRGSRKRIRLVVRGRADRWRVAHISSGTTGCVYPRPFAPEQVSGRGDPLQAVVRDLRRHFVAPLELVERDVVPERAQPWDDDAAALIDGENLIGGAVRDQEARLAVRLGADDEARRERGDAREEIAVGEAERDGVGRAVGEAAERDAPDPPPGAGTRARARGSGTRRRRRTRRESRPTSCRASPGRTPRPPLDPPPARSGAACRRRSGSRRAETRVAAPCRRPAPRASG